MTRWLLIGFSILVVAPFSASSADAGIIETEVIAATGTTYDWLPEGVMLDIYSSSTGNMIPVANNAGHIAWSADLRGTSVVFGIDDQALFRKSPDGTITMLARMGDQAAGAPEGAKWFTFSATCLAEDGTLFFRGKLDSKDGGGGVTKENDYLAGRVAPDGTITILAREGSAVPGLPSHTLKGYSGETSPPPLYPRCTADGQATFVHPITAAGSSEYALFHVDAAGTTTVVHRTGDDVPGLEPVEEFLAFARSPRINSSGQLAFRGVMQTSDTGLFGPGGNGETTLLMREGEVAPGSPAGVFEDLDVKMDKTIAADGAVAFIHSFKFDNWFVESGLWHHDPADPGVLTTLMMQSTAAADLPAGWEYGGFASLTGNKSGRLAVQGRANFGEDDLGDPIEEEEAVWVQNDAGDFVLAAITGEAAPGTGGATLVTINNALFMNASGQTTFAGTLVKIPPVDSFNDYGVWLYTPGEGLELLLREGMELVIAEDDTRAISLLTQATSFQTGSGGAEGLPLGLTDEGKALFVARFTGSAPAPGFQTNAAIVVANVAPDPCDPDKVNCDDEDACTDDSCDPEVGCQNVTIDCDDLDLCTEDSCDAELGCQNVALDCDDSDACTDDSCDEAGICQHVDLECDDLDGCTEDSCDVDAGCEYAVVDCDDSSACTEDSCDAIAGCSNVNVDCDDIDACTEDSCDVEAGCLNVAIGCDDGTVCTEDTCAPEVGCQYVDVDCNDSNNCTVDSCDALTGCAHVDVDCDDQSACTDETCDPEVGCEYVGVECDDVNLCTNDSCDPVTGCTYATVGCNDNSECTIDTCAEETGCEYEDVVCDDEDACTVDSCNPAIGCENVELKCDDNIACTIDTCDSATGCINTDKDCNDGNKCTLDICEKGKCLHQKDPDQPLCCLDDADCHDGDLCSTDLCMNELCEFEPVESCCAKDMDCKDGDVCTVDLCDQAAHECKFLPMEGCCQADADCDDGLQCIDYQCLSPWCVECDGDADCDKGSCIDLLSGNYCLDSCDGGCPDGYECLDNDCVPEAGDCSCSAKPGQLSCDGNDWVKSDNCGQFIEVKALCEFECAAEDGCCAEGEFSAGGECLDQLPPEADETDIVVEPDVPITEEIIEEPEISVGEDVPAEEDGTTAVPDLGATDSSPSGAEMVEEDSQGGGDGGCQATDSSSTSLWLLLALFATLALARRRKLTA
jgi:uncharacterized protein (TIGR03382 family)